LDAIRYNFGPTSHDPLAQLPGVFTFHFDRQGGVWQTLGSEEVGGTAFRQAVDTSGIPPNTPAADYAEICCDGIQHDAPIRWTMRPILTRSSGKKLGPVLVLPGTYVLRLLLSEPTADSAGERVMDIECRPTGGAYGQLVRDRVDVYKRAGGSGRVLMLSYPIRLPKPGAVGVTLTPVTGKVAICGALLAPADQQAVEGPNP
jgi:hypothetical protein